LIFSVTKAAVALVLGEFAYPVGGVVGPDPVVDGVGKNRPEQADASGSCAPATTQNGYAPPFRLAGLRCVTGGNRVHEALNVLPGHGDDSQPPEEWDDVPLDAAPIRKQGGGLFRPAAADQHASGFGVCKIPIAKLHHGEGLALEPLIRGRITAPGDLTKQSASFVAGRIRRPGRPVSADGDPTLSSFLGASLQDVSYDTHLSPGAKTCHRAIPDCLTRLQRPYLSQPDSLSHCPFCHTLRPIGG
jgi:hypothetical protein